MFNHGLQLGRKLWHRMAGRRPGTPPAFPAQSELYRFDRDDRELWIATPEPPHPLINILYNDSYFTILDQCARGAGRHMTAERGLTNNVIEHARIVYIRDDDTGAFFTACWDPGFEPMEYRCGAGLNYQIIEAAREGLAVTWRLWVPAGADPVEIWDVSVRDLTGRPRRVSVFTYAIMKCDGVDLDCGDLYRITRHEPALAGLFIRTDAERHQEMPDFSWHNGFITGNHAPESWEANPGAFIGGHRTLANPQAVATGRCGNTHQAMGAPCGALHYRLALAAGGEGEVRLIAGACADVAMAIALREKYAAGSLAADPHFEAMLAAQEALTHNLRVELPESAMNRMLNAWVKKQIHFGATWGHWQGWRGCRDILQQSLGILAQAPALARANLLDAARHQNADGFALRGWRPVDLKRYADSAQWMIPAATEYIKETGDFAVLEAEADYFDQGRGALREHLERALARLYEDRGAHGLCLAQGGDWNDSLTGICRHGRGESVWLTMALTRDCLLMRELYEALGEAAPAAQMARWHGELKEALNRHAWDGEWYRCAFDDDGRPVGSAQNDEGKIFLNMQSWAQLARIADDERWARAWAATQRHLDTGWGLMLNWPAYTRPDPAIGRMTWIRPGAAENAMVYTHGNAFMIMALLERGEADRALRLWREIAPGHPRRPPCQPNVFFNGYFGPDSEILPGLADHAWKTGSVAWMFYAATELMLGLRRGYDGLRLRPGLSSEWARARAVRTYRGTTYEVEIENPARRQAAPLTQLRVDGNPWPLTAALPLDGQTHAVHAVVGG